MSLENINLNPRFTQHLVHKLSAFSHAPLVVADVGARWGSESQWQVYGDQIFQIGFEPDREECDRLNQRISPKFQQFYPIALGAREENRQFHHCVGAWGSSFYPANLDFLHRFPDEHREQMEVVEITEIPTLDLDTFTQTHQILPIDFIKLDVEGCELDCLKGSLKTLEKSVLGLSLEVLIHSDLRNQPTFAEIDIFLNSQGFRLFDLSLYRYARKALPLPSNEIGATRQGQIMWGQALYLRDGVAEINLNNRAEFWDKTSILKLASLMEVFCLPDCAAELLQTAEQKEMLSIDLSESLAQLTPNL